MRVITKEKDGAGRERDTHTRRANQASHAKREQTRTRRLPGWPFPTPEVAFSKGQDGRDTGATSRPRPPSAPAWPLTIRGSDEKYWAWSGLAGAAKEKGGEVAYGETGGGIVLAMA